MDERQDSSRGYTSNTNIYIFPGIPSYIFRSHKNNNSSVTSQYLKASQSNIIQYNNLADDGKLIGYRNYPLTSATQKKLDK